MVYSLLTAQQDDIICPLTHYSLIEIAGTDAENICRGNSLAMSLNWQPVNLPLPLIAIRKAK